MQMGIVFIIITEMLMYFYLHSSIEASAMQIIHKIPEQYRFQVIALYSQVLRDGPVANILSEEKCQRMLAEVLDLDYAWAAVDRGTLLGFAGYQTAQGSFTGASTPAQLCRSLGFFCFTKLILKDFACYRPIRKGEMLHNGLVVAKDYRRQGIGKCLLQKMASLGQQSDYQCLRLDAWVSNSRALNLYRSAGYVEEGVKKHRTDTLMTLRRYI